MLFYRLFRELCDFVCFQCVHISLPLPRSRLLFFAGRFSSIREMLMEPPLLLLVFFATLLGGWFSFCTCFGTAFSPFVGYICRSLPGLCLHPESTISDASAASQGVTCGSALKLVNTHFGVRLHSHDVKYGSGSGQQSVTGTDVQEDVNSHWAIKGTAKSACTRGSVEAFE